MNQDLLIFLSAIAFIAGLFLLAWWLHAPNKKQASQIIVWIAIAVVRIAIAVVLAIIFLFLSLLIIYVSIGGGRPELNTMGQSFTIVNNTSVSLWASVNTAYTPFELEGLRRQGIDIDLTENFVTYRDTLIPNQGTDYEKSYRFLIPIPSYGYNEKWPSKLQIILTDSLGDREVRFRANDIDRTMRARMQIVVTDSMLQPRPKIMIPEHEMWWRKKGDDR